MTPDIVGWVGTALFAIGSIAIAYKLRSGFLWMLGGNLTYVVVGFMTALPSLISVSVFMAALDVFAWVKWAPAKPKAEENE